MHFLRNRAKLALVWGPANNFSEVERFTDWEPVRLPADLLALGASPPLMKLSGMPRSLRAAHLVQHNKRWSLHRIYSPALGVTLSSYLGTRD